jgi:hypothetical protein
MQNGQASSPWLRLAACGDCGLEACGIVIHGDGRQRLHITRVLPTATGGQHYLLGMSQQMAEWYPEMCDSERLKAPPCVAAGECPDTCCNPARERCRARSPAIKVICTSPWQLTLNFQATFHYATRSIMLSLE